MSSDDDEPHAEILIDDPENDERDDENDDAPWLDSPPEISFSGTGSGGIYFDSEIDPESKYLLDLLKDESTVTSSNSKLKGKDRDMQSEQILEEDGDFDASEADWEFQWPTE